MTAEGTGTSVPGAERPGRLHLRPPQEPPRHPDLGFRASGPENSMWCRLQLRTLGGVTHPWSPAVGQGE